MKKLLASLIVLLAFATSAFAQFDFPNSPTANQIISGPAGQAMKWDGTKWVAQFGAVGGPFLPEAPLDGNSYLRTNGAWTSGGTLANDLTGSAVHLTNLSGWAPLNFGQPSLAAGTDGAVTASLFAYNKGVGGNNNLNITAGAYMWNGNWVSGTPTAEAIVMNPTSISLQYSTGNTVGATLGTWNQIGVFNSSGLVLANPAGQSVIRLGPATAPWGAITTGTGASLYLSAGAHSDGTNWIADSTSATIQTQEPGGAQGYYYNTGLTVGSSYAPNELGWWGAQGLSLTSGHYLSINGVAQPNWQGINAQGGFGQGVGIAYCYNSYSVPAGGQVIIMHTGIWGAPTAGLLTVFSTYPGYAHQTLYAVSAMGSVGGAPFATLVSLPYGGGDAPFTLTNTETADGSGNHYNEFIVTNSAPATSGIQYWYTPVGGSSGVYCQ